MDIDVTIDDLTNCLVDRTTGREVGTYYRAHDALLHEQEYAGWIFDWSIPQENGYSIYELFVFEDDAVQGRIALRIDGGVANVDLVETAPHNYGQDGKYRGVGGHLFAIACQISRQNGCDGYVAFLAKTNLVKYYQEKLHAKVVAGNRMYLDEAAAVYLIGKYLER